MNTSLKYKRGKYMTEYRILNKDEICQAFYRALGCVEAQVYNKEHVEKEPYDCQMECVL